jgi:hypothetical protein
MFFETEAWGFFKEHEIGILDGVRLPRVSILLAKPYPDFLTDRRHAFFNSDPIAHDACSFRCWLRRADGLGMGTSLLIIWRLRQGKVSSALLLAFMAFHFILVGDSSSAGGRKSNVRFIHSWLFAGAESIAPAFWRKVTQ